METITCPSCGSGMVKELTDEKYMCLGCDNIFLVHNLSKEFRQTDAHIADVHEDISKKLDNLNIGLQNVNIQSGAGNATEIRMALSEAEEALKKGDFLKAYEKFKTYTVYVPDSYVGYEGMFRALTDNYNDNAGMYKRIPNDMTAENVNKLLADGTDVLKKALQCGDCDKEKVFDGFRKYYEKSLETLVYRVKYNSNPNDVEILKNIKGDKDVLQENIEQCKAEIEEMNASLKRETDMIQNSKDKVAAFNALSETERAEMLKKKKIKAGIVFAVVLLLAMLLWSKVGFLLHVVEVLVVLVVGVVCISTTGEPSEYSSEQESALKEKLEQKQKELELIQNNLSEAVQKKEIGVGNEEITNFIMQNNSNSCSAQDLYEKYSQLEASKEKTGYDVTWLENHSIMNGNIAYAKICSKGGYNVQDVKRDVHLPQIVLAKASMDRADNIVMLQKEDKDIKFKIEIADDKMYTLLLISADSWKDLEIGGNSDIYKAIIKEICGKSPNELNLDGSGQWVLHTQTTRIITRSQNKAMLLDYADRLTRLDVEVKVV